MSLVPVVVQAQYSIKKLDATPFVCVGRLTAVEHGHKGTSNLGGATREIPIALMKIEVLSSVKGILPRTITIACGSGSVQGFSHAAAGKVGTYVYPSTPNSLGLWFLQPRGDSGNFLHDYIRGDKRRTWRTDAEGVFAPVSAFVIGSHTELDFGPEELPGTDPYSRLLDVYAMNAGKKGASSYAYLNRMLELIPAEEWAGDSKVEPSHSVREKFRDYLKTTFPTRYTIETDVERMNVESLRLYACDEQDRDPTAFLDLFDRLKYSDLYLPLPPLKSPQQTLRILPRITDPMVARGYFLGLVHYPALRMQILDQAIPRLGSHPALDAGILECAARLLERSDLDPMVNGSIAADLSGRIALLKSEYERLKAAP